MGVFLLIAGTVIVLAGLGLLRVGGPKGLDINALLDRRMKANDGYPASGFSVSDAYGQSYSETTPLEPMRAERYGGMNSDDMASRIDERFRRGDGEGPGPKHPG